MTAGVLNLSGLIRAATRFTMSLTTASPKSPTRCVSILHPARDRNCARRTKTVCKKSLMRSEREETRHFPAALSFGSQGRGPLSINAIQSLPCGPQTFLTTSSSPGFMVPTSTSLFGRAPVEPCLKPRLIIGTICRGSWRRRSWQGCKSRPDAGFARQGSTVVRPCRGLPVRLPQDLAGAISDIARAAGQRHPHEYARQFDRL